MAFLSGLAISIKSLAWWKKYNSNIFYSGHFAGGCSSSSSSSFFQLVRLVWKCLQAIEYSSGWLTDVPTKNLGVRSKNSQSFFCNVCSKSLSCVCVCVCACSRYSYAVQGNWKPRLDGGYTSIWVPSQLSNCSWSVKFLSLFLQFNFGLLTEFFFFLLFRKVFLEKEEKNILK